jgi:hypothetical protein
MDKTPTAADIDRALDEMDELMGICDGAELEMLCALYAKAYVLKLQLMKEPTK